MDVLDDEGEKSLAAITLARLTDGAVGWIGPEALVVSSPIVVARQAESGGKREDQERGRERKEGGNP